MSIAAQLVPALFPALLAVGTPTTANVTSSPACRDALDAVVESGRAVCRSPGGDADAQQAVAADAVPAPPPTSPDPGIFPGEIGFASVVIGLGGIGAVAGAYALSADPTTARDQDLTPPALFYGGVSALGLAGLVAGAALSTVVFDPSTGKLRLPIFDAEDQ